MVHIIEVEERLSKGHDYPLSLSSCPTQEYQLSSGAEVQLETGKEVQQNFILEFRRLKNHGTISGVVRNKSGQCIPDTLVKVFDHHHNPITHVFTNREGQYLICLPPGRYILKAVK